jgi:hypothetical protein
MIPDIGAIRIVSPDVSIFVEAISELGAPLLYARQPISGRVPPLIRGEVVKTELTAPG